MKFLQVLNGERKPFEVSDKFLISAVEPADPPLVQAADNSYIVIPLMSFVFAFPIAVIVLLCALQQRNKHIQRREIERARQQRRLSWYGKRQTAMYAMRYIISTNFWSKTKKVIFHGPKP